MSSAMNPVIQFRLLRPEARVPVYATSGAGAFDLHVAAFVNAEHEDIRGEEVHVRPGWIYRMAIGLQSAIPAGHGVLVLPRSGLGIRGLTIAQDVALIDSDYRGEWVLPMVCTGNDPVTVHLGDRIAQAIILPMPQAMIQVVSELPASERGAGGFGSTGVR